MDRYSVREQAKMGVRTGSAIALTTAAILGATYLITRRAGIPFTDLTRDAAATFEGPWYTGSLSNSSIAQLLAGSGIALFAASLLPASHGRSIKGLLNAIALLMIFVAIDDLFMLHEAVYPELGITTMTYLVAYGGALVAILWIWRAVILGSTDYVFLVLAGLGMGISVALDVIVGKRLFSLPFSGELVEDPAKIVGMVFMAFYLIVTARQALLLLLTTESKAMHCAPRGENRTHLHDA